MNIDRAEMLKETTDFLEIWVNYLEAKEKDSTDQGRHIVTAIVEFILVGAKDVLHPSEF